MCENSGGAWPSPADANGHHVTPPSFFMPRNLHINRIVRVDRQGHREPKVGRGQLKYNGFPVV